MASSGAEVVVIVGRDLVGTIVGFGRTKMLICESEEVGKAEFDGLETGGGDGVELLREGV